MSRKSFRHILLGLSIAAVAIGLSEVPASAGTQTAAIASSKATSSSALGTAPIEISASASPAGDRVAASTMLPDLAQPTVPETTQSAFLTQRMLLAQSTTQPAQSSPTPLPPRPATPYQTNPDTNPDATSPRPTVPDTASPSAIPPGANSPEISPAQTLPEQTPSSPTNPTPTSPSPTSPNPSAPPPVEPGAPTPSPSTPPTEPMTPAPSSTPSTPGVDRTSPGTFTPDTNNVSPGRATRSGSSYIGIGGNIGLGSGNTALGEGSFSVFSKVGLTSNVSVRPSVLVSDSPTILLPITLDLTPRVTNASESLSNEIGRRISPFIGAGIAISTGNDSAVDFLATAGVDVPISRRFTGTAAVNATLFDNPAVGLQLGIGYNF